MSYPYYYWGGSPFYNYGYFPFVPKPYVASDVRKFAFTDSLHNTNYVYANNDLSKSSNENSSKDSELEQKKRNEEKPLFDLMGIKIFSDDLLLLGVLYFLYSEEVRDPELFIAILLLLIS